MKKLENWGCHSPVTTLTEGRGKGVNGAKAKAVRRSEKQVKKLKSQFKTDKDPRESIYFNGFGFRKQADMSLNNLQG